MDPNQTYRDLQDAMQEQDHETARALALVLKRWLASGGFYPQHDSPKTIDSLIADVLRETSYLSH